MNYTLPGIRKIYMSPITGDTINYHYSASEKVVIDQSIAFNLKQVENVGFTQSKLVDNRGSYFQKQFDLTVANVADTVIEDFENKSLVILFEDNNGNFWITGHKKPYSVDKQDYRINDDNSIEFSISQVYQDKIEPIQKNWIDNNNIEFPIGGEFNIPENFTAVTGGSIILSWTNKDYTVQYDGFTIIRTNPIGHPSGSIQVFYITGKTATGLTQSPDYIFGGIYRFNIALSNEGENYLFSNTISVNAPNPNRIIDLSSSVDGNDIVLSWTNRDYRVSYTGYTIERTNPVGHPSGSTSYFYLNSTGLTSFRDVNVGNFSDLETLGTYKYKIAITGNEWSNEVTQVITNYNVPRNLVAYDDGDGHIILSWENPDPVYSIPVQSFVINYLFETTPGNWSSQPLIVYPDNGTSTTYSLSPLISGNYRFQIAIAKNADGTSRSTFTIPLVQTSFVTLAVPPTLSLNNNSTTTYYGGSFITPSLHVIGGDGGDVTLKYHISNDSPSTVGSAINKTQLITVNNTTYDVNLEQNPNGIRGGYFHVTLDTDATYNLGTPITKTFNVPALTNSGKVEGTSLSGGAGTNVSITWTAYSDSNSLAGWGYIIGRYLTSNPSVITTFLVSGMATTSYTDTTSSSLTYGNYTYYVRAINVSNILSIADAVVYMSPTYPDMVPINISAAPTVPSAPSLNCNSTRTTTTAQLTWSPVGDTTGYKLWVQDAFSGAIIYNDTNVGNVTSYNVTLSPANGYNFYFKVKAYNAVGDGSYSSAYGFVVQPPASNTLTMTSRTSSQIVIDWNDVSFIGTYRVQRATNSSFTTGLVESSDLVNSNYTITGLSSATTYYIRVKAITYVDSPCGGSVDSAWSGTLTQATT